MIGALKKRQGAWIDHCEDTKHYIEPLIDAGNGKIGRLSPYVKVRFEVRETGLLIWPQFLWCGGFDEMSTTTKPKIRSAPNEGSAAIRHEDDLYGWVEQQVALLRAGRVADIDASNIAEELSDVGVEQYDKLESSIRVVLLHLLKWDHQPDRRSRSWMLSIAEHRRRVFRVLKKNPSLKSSRDEAVDEAYDDAKGDAWRETGLPGDTFPRVCPYAWDEIVSRAIVFDDLQSPEQ